MLVFCAVSIARYLQPSQEGTALATRVILVRHGISSFNAERRIQGLLDESVLTEAGEDGARRAGQALRSLSFNAVYASPLRRARQTAELITAQFATAPAIHFTDQLREVNLAGWEGLLFDELKQRFPEQYEIWRSRPHDLQLQINTSTGLQPFYPLRSLYDQARQFWRELLPQHPNQTVLLVAHSGINRALIQTAIGLDADRFNRFQQTNCGISVLNFAGTLGDLVQIESMNATAHLNLPVPPKKTELQGPRILLVRHGETDWNRDQRFQGQIDVPLNDQGRVQAEKAAFFLQDIAIDAAVSSPMLRPCETAEIILKAHAGISLSFDDRLKEISHGLWEGKLESEIRADYATELEQWKVAPETVQMPEGENLTQVWERAIAAWNTLVAAAAPGSTVLVVAHDAINKAILASVVGAGPNQFWSFKQGNGAVSVIDYPRGAAEAPLVQALNITSHLGEGVLDRTAAGAL
jgi:probable phosphoglycerate mutase